MARKSRKETSPFAMFWRKMTGGGKTALWEKSEYGAWAETLNPLRGLTEQRARDIFDRARRGVFAELTYLYGEIEAADPTLLTVAERRESVVGASDWKITLANPERTSGYDQALAEDQQGALYAAYGLARDGLGEVAEHLERGFFRGFAHARPLIGPHGLEGFDLLDQWNFALDKFTGQWWWNPNASNIYDNDFSEIPQGELVTVQRQRHIDYPGLLIFIRAALGEKKYGVFLERYGIPPVTVVMPPDVGRGEEQEYFEAAEKLAQAGYGAMPHGSSVNYATEARGTNPFLEFLRHQQELMVLMATGGTLTTLASPTGIGSGASEAQMDVWRDIVRRDIRVAARAIDKIVTPKLLAERFPGRPVLAQFEFDVDPKPTASEAFDDAAKARTAGYLIDREQLEEVTGYRLVLDEGAAGGMGGFGLHSSGHAPATPLQNASTSAAAGAGAAPGAELEAPGVAALTELARALTADLAPVSARVAALLELPEAERQAAARELLDELPELLPDDPETAAVLEEAIADTFVAALADRTSDRKINLGKMEGQVVEDINEQTT